MILHITNDYSGSTVYKNLIKELDNNHIPQIVYTPVKSVKSIDKNKVVLSTKDSEIIYSHILNKHLDRAFYKRKITKILRDIEQKVDMSKIKFIHAHTWYSDGGVAYLLNKKYNIPFIVAVRSTDVDIFYKFQFFERNFGREILNSAKNIILISQIYKSRLIKILNLKADKKENKIIEKLIIIPNGIDGFWLENSISKKPALTNDKFHLIYVGTFIKRKKLEQVQKAIIKLNKKVHKYHLHIVGGNGGNESKVLSLIKRFPDYFSYYGYISDKKKLLELYNQSDAFIMPSKRETFGLVYLEALTQGLPIIYVKNEGIDGLYENVGETVMPNNINTICKGIQKMRNNYEEYNYELSQILTNHDWKRIANLYNKIYKM